MTFVRPERDVDRVFLHCSASDQPGHDNIETIRRWHVDDNGWSDVGYHFFIRRNGRREAGRPLERTPAAQAGHNAGTIAICLHGLAKDRFTRRQFEELAALCDEIDAAYGEGGVTYHGHCEVSDKSCPVFDYRTVLGLDANGERSAPANAQPPEVMPQSETSPDPVLRRTASGERVELLQALLVANGATGLAVDGQFGQATQDAVESFQERRGLHVDGVAGPETWGALRRFAGPSRRAAAGGRRAKRSSSAGSGSRRKVAARASGKRPQRKTRARKKPAARRRT